MSANCNERLDSLHRRASRRLTLGILQQSHPRRLGDSCRLASDDESDDYVFNLSAFAWLRQLANFNRAVWRGFHVQSNIWPGVENNGQRILIYSSHFRRRTANQRRVHDVSALAPLKEQFLHWRQWNPGQNRVECGTLAKGDALAAASIWRFACTERFIVL